MLGTLLEVWKAYGNILVAGGLFFIWLGIKSERKKLQQIHDDLGERLETLGQQVKATQDSMERTPDVAAPATDNGGITNWEEIRSDWRKIRDRIELKIQKIPHKSTRGKYSRLDRYSYVDVVQELLKDKQITAPVAAALLNMNALFLKLRRRTQSVQQSEVEEYKNWSKSVGQALPELPLQEGRSEGPEEQPPSAT